MKKVSLLVLAIVAAIGTLMPAKAQAQRGEMTLGLMGGFATYNNGGFADVYFQIISASHQI